MIRSVIRVTERFPVITERVEQLARESVDEAAAAASEVAQAEASIDLELEVKPATGDLDGYSAGITSRKETRDPKRTTRIAGFFDGGTLGKRKKPLKQPGRREESWQVKRGDTVYTARRGGITADMGIEAEGFFGKALAAGRRALKARIERGL